MTDEPTAPPADNGGSPEGGAPPPTPEAATEGGPAPWHNVLPKEYREDPNFTKFKSIGDLAKSYRDLSGLLGREPRVPAKDAPPDQWNQFYAALGRPDTPDKYTLPVPEGEGAPEVLPKVVDGFRNVAHEVGLTGSQAHKLAEWYFGTVAEESDAVAAEIAGRTERVERELKREFGQAYENTVKAATKFFLDFGGEELIEWMETSGEGSNPALIRLGAKAAMALTEDKLGAARPSDFGYTPQAAQAEIGRLRMDKEFSAAYYDKNHPGHTAAVERMATLHNAAFPTEEPA